jgi:hypothetical protein
VLLVTKLSDYQGRERVLLRAITLGLIILLTGCATEAGFKEKMDTWVGRPVGDLIMAWGAPNQTYESGGTKYLTYVHSTEVEMPGTSPSYNSYVIGNNVYTDAVGGSPPYTIHAECDVTFQIVDEKIVGYSSRGNNCYA